VTTNTPQPPAGWYPDPQGTGGQRWWNGSAWSAQTRATPAPPVPPVPPYAGPGYGAVQPGYGAQPGYPAQPGYATPPGYGTPPAYGAANPYQPSGYAYGSAPIGSWRSPADDRPVVTGMGGAIRTVFMKYARFDGRAGRPEFWYWTLFYAIILAAAYALVIVGALASFGMRYGYGMAPVSGLFGVLIWLWVLAAFLPTLAVQVRRLRDGGYHWGFVFLSLVPFGAIAVLVMCAMPSKYP